MKIVSRKKFTVVQEKSSRRLRERDHLTIRQKTPENGVLQTMSQSVLHSIRSSFCLTSISLQGMDHNPGLTDAEDVALYLSRDLHKRKDRKAPPPYEIIRDEVVGR